MGQARGKDHVGTPDLGYCCRQWQLVLLAHWQPPKKRAESPVKMSFSRVAVWAFIHLLGSSPVGRPQGQ